MVHLNDYHVSNALHLDLLQLSGIGHTHGPGATGNNVQSQPATPSSSEEQKISGATGSDILDASTHELRLEKSNILMLGPTGSGTTHYLFPRVTCAL